MRPLKKNYSQLRKGKKTKPGELPEEIIHQEEREAHRKEDSSKEPSKYSKTQTKQETEKHTVKPIPPIIKK